MLRPTVTSAVIVISAYVAYALLPASIRNSETLGWLMTLPPGVAGLYVASHAPRHRILLAFLMAPLAAATVSVVNFLYWQGGGLTDFPGVRGAAIVAQLQLVTAVPFALLGGVLGRLLAKRRVSAAREPTEPHSH